MIGTDSRYLGSNGCTSDCLDAIAQVIQSEITGRDLLKATLLTHQSEHAFMLTFETMPEMFVRSGFTSGYLGEGPRGLSRALGLLLSFKIEIEEVEIDERVMARLNGAALKWSDIEMIQTARVVRPFRLYEYIEDRHRGSVGSAALWDLFPRSITLAIVDVRIHDLVLKFRDSWDSAISDGYKRLEMRIRDRIGSEKYGARLFDEAFGDQPKLTWPTCGKNEIVGRAMLFKATFMSYRNPRAHNEIRSELDIALSEFMLLNHLFVLESEAVSVDH